SRYCAYRAAFEELPREAIRMYCTSPPRRTAATSSAWARCRSRSLASAFGWSCSSASSHDTRLAPAEHPDDLEPVVEHDHVARCARLEHAEIGPPEDSRRHCRRGADGVLERDAERV